MSPLNRGTVLGRVPPSWRVPRPAGPTGPDPARRAAGGAGGAGRRGNAAEPVARPTPTFGAYPSYLPKDTLNRHSDAVLTGTIQRPALTNEGDAVKVKTPSGRCW